MGLLDKIRERLGPLAGGGAGTGDRAGGFGGTAERGAPQAGAPQPGAPQPGTERDPDEVAVERYRYMLRTAPPETVEQAHAEAFAKLTPEQRRKVLEDVGQTVPESERATSDDPQSLARMATRAEMRQPGTMENALGGGRGGMGMGGMIAGTLLASVAGAFIGTAIADAFLGDALAGGDLGGADLAAGEAAAGDVAAGEAADAGIDPAAELGDAGMGDVGGMDGFEI